LSEVGLHMSVAATITCVGLRQPKRESNGPPSA